MAIQSSICVETINLLMRRLASVCDKHRVASGLPADLADFLTALEHDKLLAMDFWAVVGGMNAGLPSAAEDGLSNQSESANAQSEEMQEQVLEAIVRVLTGLGVSEMISAGDQTPQAVEDLKSLMGGRDMQSRPMEATDAKLVAAEPSNGRAFGHTYQTMPGIRPGQPQADQSQAGDLKTDKARVKNQKSGFTSRGPLESEKGIAPDGNGSLNDSAWSDILITDWVAADLKDAEQNKRAAAANRVPLSAGRDDGDLRRVLFGEESQRSGEAATPNRPGVMKPVKVAAAWMEPRQIVRLMVSALLIVAISAVIIRLQDTGVLRSYAGSIQEMFSKFGTDEDVPDGSANAAKGAAQPIKSRGVSRGHPQKAHPAKPENGSVDTAAKLESAETMKDKGDSNTVAEKLPVAYETARGGSTEASVSAAKDDPIEVTPEVMKANLITPAGPDSSFATGLGEGNSRVVMQVVISKVGVVVGLRVTEGDPALRAAATRAVSAWRYHPYMVNGVPVAVRTTVTVNFKMDS